MISFFLMFLMCYRNEGITHFGHIQIREQKWVREPIFRNRSAIVVVDVLLPAPASPWSQNRFLVRWQALNKTVIENLRYYEKNN